MSILEWNKGIKERMMVHENTVVLDNSVQYKTYYEIVDIANIVSNPKYYDSSIPIITIGHIDENNSKICDICIYLSKRVKFFGKMVYSQYFSSDNRFAEFMLHLLSYVSGIKDAIDSNATNNVICSVFSENTLKSFKDNFIKTIPGTNDNVMIWLSKNDAYSFSLTKSRDGAIIKTWQTVSSSVVKIDKYGPVVCIGEGDRDIFKEHFMIYPSGDIRFKDDLLYTEGSSLTLWYDEMLLLLKLSEVCRKGFCGGQLDLAEIKAYDNISNKIKTLLVDYGNIKLEELYYENIVR